MPLAVVIKRNALSSSVGYVVQQENHGFSVGEAVKQGNSQWIRAKSDNRQNAGAAGIVAEIFDANTFRMLTEGFIEGDYEKGKIYFVSVAVAGGLMTQSDPEVWQLGQVRQVVGVGVEGGLLVSLDIGDEIVSELITDKIVTDLLFNPASRRLTLKQSGGLPDKEVVIPGAPQAQADWAEADIGKASFIKNKPQLKSLALMDFWVGSLQSYQALPRPLQPNTLYFINAPNGLIVEVS